jgi:hypothetical protein
MRDCFCSDFNETSKTGSEKQVDEVPQKIKQERALRQYREEKDDIFFSGWESVLCSKGATWFR